MDLKPLQAWNEKNFTLNPDAKGTWVSSTDARGNEKIMQLFGSKEVQGQVGGMNAQDAAEVMHREMVASAQKQRGSEMER